MSMMQMLLSGGGATPGGVPISLIGTWDAANKSANVTLSNSNLTMTGTNPSYIAWAKSTNSLSSGAAYVEFLISGTTGTVALGVCNSSAIFNDGDASNPNATTYLSNGQIYQNGGTTTPFAAYGANGDIIGMWVNRAAGWVQFYKNNVTVAGAMNIPTGALFLVGSAYQRSVTLNKKPTYDLPTGAKYWGN